MTPDDQNQNTTLAVLVRDVHHIGNAVSEMRTQLSAYTSTHINREEMKAVLDTQSRIHDDIEKRLRRQEETNGHIETRLAKMSTEIKVWLTVGAFIIGTIEAVALAFLTKTL